MNMIFQDPFSSLSPRMTINQIISEPLRMQNVKTPEIQDRVKILIEKVGLQISHLNRYPNSFSGGQRQRIAIARAVLRNAPILVLDEALSSVDAENEAVIQGALDRLMVGRTTLIFAHRLSSVIGADRLLALEDGRIVETGTHQELMELGGAYHRLMSRQVKEYEVGSF